MNIPSRHRWNRKTTQTTPRRSHWAEMWKCHPERLREHVGRMTAARAAKSEERGRLIQAVFDMIPTDPMRPFELRDMLAVLWSETYGEPLSKKQAWAVVKSAQRRAMVGQTDDNLYFVRHSA